MSVNAIVGAGVCAAYIVLSKCRRKKRKMWMRHYYKQRSNEILRELLQDSDELFKNFTRMSPVDFHYLLDLVRPQITKEDTVMREAVPADIRLAVTLRYLATGDSFCSLSYLFHISNQCISTIVCETVTALVKVLKEKSYVQVSKDVHGNLKLVEM